MTEKFDAVVSCISRGAQDGKIVFDDDCDKDAERIIGNNILLAVDRKLNTDNLDLDKAGVETDEWR